MFTTTTFVCLMQTKKASYKICTCLNLNDRISRKKICRRQKKKPCSAYKQAAVGDRIVRRLCLSFLYFHTTIFLLSCFYNTRQVLLFSPLLLLPRNTKMELMMIELLFETVVKIFTASFFILEVGCL